MPGADITIAARTALRKAVRSNYTRTIKDRQWSTMIPSDPPPKGLGSRDKVNWHITLTDAVGEMEDVGYTMRSIAEAEAAAVRTRPLNASVTQLEILVIRSPSATRLSQLGRWTLYLGAGVLAGGAIGLSVSRLLRERGR